MVVKIEEGRRKSHSLKQFWDWLLNSDSILSYIAFLVIIFIFIKFIFLPGLGFIFHAQGLPLAIVESSSMEHYSLQETSEKYVLCGKSFPSTKFFNLDNYWAECGSWYESRNISKADFSNFPFKNGFRKGDIMVIWGWNKPELGDVLVFNAGRNHPIIHRIISLSPLQTKGDHNSDQLSSSNNAYRTDETNIDSSQIIGKAVFRIPYVGWLKLFFVQMFS